MNSNRIAVPFFILLLLPHSLFSHIVFPNKGRTDSPQRVQNQTSQRGEEVPGNKTRKPAAREKHVSASVAARMKRQRGLQLLENVLASVDQIKPLEYGLFARVEAAIMLLPIDKERSTSHLKSAVKTMRAVLDQQKQSKKSSLLNKTKEERLYYLSMRRIISVRPELLDELFTEPSDQNTREILDWTDEARAMITIGYDNI